MPFYVVRLKQYVLVITYNNTCSSSEQNKENVLFFHENCHFYGLKLADCHS